jgi:hypothetical protein
VNLIVALALVAAAAVLALLPRRLIRRSQDRLAAEILSREGEAGALRLLTPAEKFVGAYRRVPGVLGMRGGDMIFETSFGDSWTLPMGRVRKIVSGKVLSSGRRLFRDEALMLVDAEGVVSEFQMPHASASQWRRLLSEWAARQKASEAVVLTPGKSAK